MLNDANVVAVAVVDAALCGSGSGSGSDSGNENENEKGKGKRASRDYLEHLLNVGCNEHDSGAALALPKWYDAQRFERGQDYLRKYRFVMIMGMWAGLLSVLAITSIRQVLICTRKSATAATAYRRYARTLQHTLAWYENRVTSRKFWTSVRAVRNAHAQTSRACMRNQAGAITQKDLALTQFGFIGYITLGASRIELDDLDFLECSTHMWRVMGYLLGIKDEYNICGRNWAETKPRFERVLHQVFKPALELHNTEFERMAHALIDGFWPMHGIVTYGVQMYLTKRLSYCRGYEYYDFDYLPGTRPAPAPAQRPYYDDLNWYDRLIVSYGLFMATFLHKYAFFRWCLNFQMWLLNTMSYYCPYLAIWMFGWKRAYVRVFVNDSKANTLDLDIKMD